MSTPYRKGDVPYLIAEPSLAQKELGFNAPQDLDTMCRDLWNWQLRNPQGLAGPFITGDLDKAAETTKAIIQETKAASAGSSKDLPPLPSQKDGVNGATA